MRSRFWQRRSGDARYKSPRRLQRFQFIHFGQFDYQITTRCWQRNFQCPLSLEEKERRKIDGARWRWTAWKNVNYGLFTGICDLPILWTNKFEISVFVINTLILLLNELEISPSPPSRKVQFKCKFSTKLNCFHFPFRMCLLYVFVATTLGWRPSVPYCSEKKRVKSKAFHAFLSPTCDRLNDTRNAFVMPTAVFFPSTICFVI